MAKHKRGKPESVSWSDRSLPRRPETPVGRTKSVSWEAESGESRSEVSEAGESVKPILPWKLIAIVGQPRGRFTMNVACEYELKKTARGKVFKKTAELFSSWGIVRLVQRARKYAREHEARYISFSPYNMSARAVARIVELEASL